jgi:hypothetical protein
VSAPLPPDDLESRSPEIVILAQGVVIERFYTAAFDPIHFDRSHDGRFNAPDGGYGVLYTSQTLRGAFAETFLRDPGRTLIPLDLLRRKARVRLKTARVLRLTKLAGTGLARLGATAEVVHGGLPYDVPQAWSMALHGHPLKADGIAYTARHDDEALCYALFDRDAKCVEMVSREKNIDQDWFWEIADLYGVGLAPS